MLQKVIVPKLPDKTSQDDRLATPFFWYHLSNPTADEILDCSRRWRFPVDYLSAVLDPDEVPRGAGLFPKRKGEPVLIALLYPVNESNEESEADNKTKLGLITASGTYSTRLLSIVWTSDVLLTCSHDEINFSEILGERRHADSLGQNGISDEDTQRLEPEMNLNKPEKVIAALIWEINQQYIRATRVLNLRTKKVQRLISHSAKTELLMTVSQLQESLVLFRSAIEQNHPIIKSLQDFDLFLSDEEQQSWLIDILTESRQAESMVFRSSRLLEQLNQTFASIISNNLNGTMKKLTSITIILTIPTIIGSFWGMNVALPLEKLDAAFFILLGGIAVLSLIATLVLHRKDLI